MTDIWYYAGGGKAVGPLSLTDLTAMLSHDLDPTNVLIWRAGFKQWQRAETVPELEAFVIKPPPLPPSLQSGAQLPFDQTLRVDNQDRDLAAHRLSERRNYTGSIVSVMVIAIVIGGIRYFTHSNASISHPDSAIISGGWRQDFVSGGMDTCVRKQESDSD